MANPFRNAMAFLGLVEEDDYEEQPAPQPRAQAATPVQAAPAPRAAVTPLPRRASGSPG